MSKAKARVFVPLTKVDEEQRLVYGTITQEILDKSGEVMDYESSKPLFEEWSNGIHEASGGLSKGNLRVMHGLSVAGKVTDINFDDETKAIDVCSKVVDDAEWNKVIEGCYTGFSVGGSYAKRWTENGVKKFTAKPNEVSLVDNPCVPSATFSLVKADGAEEQVQFKVENDDDKWPEFSKADADAEEEKVEKAETPTPEDTPITNDQVVARAEVMAKAANDGTTWMNHVEAAREALVKEASSGKAQKETEEGGDAKGKQKETETSAPNEGDEASSSDDDAKKADFAIADRLSQKWVTTDGQTFDKKADAEAHEATLTKAEPTEADKLRERLGKALNPEPVIETDLMEDWDRLGKAVQALETPFENGAPKLEKGMYTVSRFANVLWDLGSLARKIAKEGATEGADGDASDKKVSGEIKDALATLGDSFKTYVDNQITELLAGIDDDVLVEVYDYYYAAAKDESENQLAKDVCSLIDDRREVAGERRETLVKAFGLSIPEVTEQTDEMTPLLKKRFDDLEAENTELRKVAGEAVEAVETLTKRLDKLEETPMPPAPRNVQLRDGDGNFLGKSANTKEEKIAVLNEMLKTLGPDQMALELIKLSHQRPIPAMTRG